MPPVERVGTTPSSKERAGAPTSSAHRPKATTKPAPPPRPRAARGAWRTARPSEGQPVPALGALIDEAVALYRANGLFFVLLTAVPGALVLLLQSVVGSTLSATTLLLSGGATFSEAVALHLAGLAAPLGVIDGGALVSYVFAVLAVVFLNGLAAAAVALAVVEHRAGRTTTLRGIAALLTAQASTVLGGLLLYGLRLLAALLLVRLLPLVGVPVLVYVYIVWYFIPQTLVLGGADAVTASGQSRRVVGSGLLSVALLWALAYVVLTNLTTILFSVLTWVTGSLAGFDSVASSGSNLLVGASVVAITLLLQPLVPMVAALLYLNLAERTPQAAPRQNYASASPPSEQMFPTTPSE